MSEWVTTLIDRLSRGLEEGTYEIIPGTEPASEEDKHRNSDVACLVSLLGVAPEKNDVLWIDDRWANRHLRGGTTPIVDVLDILRSLRSSAVLTDAQYYAKLSRLRAGNVWFYPVDQAEILWHLWRASAGEAGVAETVGLKSLRRGLASCLLRSNILLKPTDPQVQAGHFEEASFVLSFNHAVSEAIAAVWKSEEASDSRIARADWLLRNLYVDIHVLKRLNGIASTPFDAVSLTATRFALLISKVFGMPFSGTGAEKTREYVRWLVTRVLEGPLRNEPGLAAQTASILKRMFLDVAPKAIRTNRAKALMALLHQYLDLLPDPIRDELNRDPEFASRLKVRSTLVVEIAGYRFERSAFLEAATEAVNGRERTISDLPGKETFLLKGCLDSNSACGLVLEKQGDPKGTFEVRDALFGVLKESPSAREELLRRERHLFDMPEAEFAHFVAAVASTADPGRRMLKAEEERAKSGAYYYQELYQALSDRHAFNRSELIWGCPLG